MSDVAPRKERKQQIRPALAEAIVQMVERGRTISEAAELAGLQEESLRKALAKPHVKAHVAGVARAWKAGETFQSWHTVSRLRKDAESEKVRLDAAKVFITAAGELEPERERAPALGVAIQIIVPEGRSPEALQVTDEGVIESPAFDPAAWRARANVHQPAHAQADA